MLKVNCIFFFNQTIYTFTVSDPEDQFFNP